MQQLALLFFASLCACVSSEDSKQRIYDIVRSHESRRYGGRDHGGHEYGEDEQPRKKSRSYVYQPEKSRVAGDYYDPDEQEGKVQVGSVYRENVKAYAPKKSQQVVASPVSHSHYAVVDPKTQESYVLVDEPARRPLILDPKMHGDYQPATAPVVRKKPALSYPTAKDYLVVKHDVYPKSAAHYQTPLVKEDYHDDGSLVDIAHYPQPVVKDYVVVQHDVPALKSEVQYPITKHENYEAKPLLRYPKHEIKPVVHYPVSIHEAKQVVEYPVIKHEAKPLVHYPTLKHDTEPVVHYPVLKHETKPVVHYPIAQHEAKLVYPEVKHEVLKPAVHYPVKDYGHYGASDKSHRDYGHGHYEDNSILKDSSHKSHGQHQKGGHKAYSETAGHHDEHDRHHNRGVYERDRGYHYEKAYAYDRVRAEHDIGGSRGSHSAYRGAHGVEDHHDSGHHGSESHSHLKSANRHGHRDHNTLHKGYDEYGHRYHG